MRTNMVFAVWVFTTGIAAIVKPGFFFKAEKLNAEKVRRNTRIWRACGAALVCTGAAAFILELLRK